MRSFLRHIVSPAYAYLFALLFVPRYAHAQTIQDILEVFSEIFDALMPVAVATGLAIFFWGIVKFIWQGADPRARETGRTFMIWGVIALFVMVSVWGLVEVLSSIFDADTGGGQSPPTVQIV